MMADRDQLCIIRIRGEKEKGLPQSTRKYNQITLLKREDAEWLFGNNPKIEIIPCKYEIIDRSAKHFHLSPIKE